MPFRQTSPTTGRRGMLSDKYRMPAHGCLLTVIGRKRGRQPFGNKIRGVLFDNRRAFIQTILPFFLAKAKSRAKR